VSCNKLPHVAVGWEKEDGIKLLANAQSAPDANAKEGEGDEKYSSLEDPRGEAFRIDGHEGNAKVPALRRLVFLVNKAG